MRVVRVVAGIIVGLVGVAWALQGAYVLPATFMRGPEWIGIGTLVALGGVALLLTGLKSVRPPA